MMMSVQLCPQLLEDFRLNLQERERSIATIRKYMHDLRVFAEFAGDAPIDKAILMKYKEYLAESYAVTSANSMIASMNTFLHFVQLDSLCLRPLRMQHMPYTPEEKEITLEEYRRLIATAELWGDLRLMMIIQTIGATGIRISELGYITVEAAKKGEAVVRCKGKTRTIFLVQTLRIRLLCYARDFKITEGPIFLTRTGRPISRTTVWRQMKQICERARVDPQKVFPHNLRHLFARTFYDIEKDLAKLSDILGHSSINTTRIYISTTAAQHREKMEQMHLVM